jgi:hypothetical protein
MAKWNMKSFKGTSPWPSKTITVTNKAAKMTPRQTSFAKMQTRMVKKSLDMK